MELWNFNWLCTNHRQISLTGNDHCNIKLSEKYSGLKMTNIQFSKYFRKFARKPKRKGYIVEGCGFTLISGLKMGQEIWEWF